MQMPAIYEVLLLTREDYCRELRPLLLAAAPGQHVRMVWTPSPDAQENSVLAATYSPYWRWDAEMNRHEPRMVFEPPLEPVVDVPYAVNDIGFRMVRLLCNDPSERLSSAKGVSRLS